jgi:hypothetical protein
MARAVLWTSDVTQQLVVKLRAARNAVTYVTGVKTHRGSATSVEPWACDVIFAITTCFIFVVRTVKDAVAAQIRQQAVAVSRTLELGFRTCDAVFVVTPCFVLTTGTVEHAVATHMSRQTEAISCTLEVGLRAGQQPYHKLFR